jgi:hypothetical protein
LCELRKIEPSTLTLRSNLVLQALLVLINKPPPREDRKLMVLGTTAVPEPMHQLGLTQVFNVELALPLLETDSEVATVLQHMTKEDKAPLEVKAHALQEIAQGCHKPITVKKYCLS